MNRCIIVGTWDIYTKYQGSSTFINFHEKKQMKSPLYILLILVHRHTKRRNKSLHARYGVLIACTKVSLQRTNPFMNSIFSNIYYWLDRGSLMECANANESNITHVMSLPVFFINVYVVSIYYWLGYRIISLICALLFKFWAYKNYFLKKCKIKNCGYYNGLPFRTWC